MKLSPPVNLGLPISRCGNLGLVNGESFTRFDPHRHQECEINFVACGSAKVIAPGKKWDLQSGDVLLLPSFYAHNLLSASSDVRLWVLVLRPEEAHGFPLCEPVRMELDSRSVDVCDRIATDLAPMRDDATADAGLRYLFARLRIAARQIETRPARTLHPALFRAVEILRHAEGAIGAEELARQAGISAPHLLRVVKEETGLTLTGLRQTIRLREFLRFHSESPGERLLANALRAGFGSYNQFARVFTHAFGMTPKRYFLGEDGNLSPHR